MSDITTLLEIFGGTGAVILAVGTCMWKCFQRNDYELKEGFWDRNVPQKTLSNNWETKGEDFPPLENFGSNWRRRKFSKSVKKNDVGIYKVNVKKKHGNVYVYIDNTETPPPQNGGQHFLRVKLSHVPKNAEMKFELKHYQGDLNCWVPSAFHFPKEKDIKPRHWCCCFKNTVYTFEPYCKIGDKDVTKDQIGICLTGGDVPIDDVYIEEAYLGEKLSIKNIFCCGRQKYTLLSRKRQKINDDN